MNSKTFDYVIVGAGSAGCVLANRLSADADVSVCLLEAGRPDSSFLIKLPAGIMALMWDPRHNWRYYTEPEPHMNQRRMYCPRGKVIGGSSAINAMCFVRGAEQDFDQWNIDGWRWKDLLPHYLATQKQLRPGLSSNSHGYAGEQLVADTYHTVDQLSHDFVQAVVESGLAPMTNDFNGGELEGAGIYQTFQTGHGQRCSGAHAFLHPVNDRSNLTVMPKVFAEKIIINGKIAEGVQCVVKRKRMRLMANNEVIVSAGAISSPQLLMLSGIGAADELAEHNIDQTHELPGVGKNLHDHLDIVLNTRINSYQGLGISIPFIVKFFFEVVRYIRHGKGILSSNGAEAGGFIKSNPSLDVPDIQLHFAPLLLQRHFLRTLGHGICLHLCNLQPKSRGSIRLKSANPKHKPAITFNYGEHPDDMRVMIKAVKLGRKILSAPSLQKHAKREHTPGIEIQSDVQIEEFIRENAETIYHPVGSCKMGSDDLSVVDNQLRVHGIKKLRVVDASIMPTINSGNTHATVVAIANKAAHHILALKNS